VEKQILMAAFSEEDVVAGAPVSGAFRTRVLINQATGVPPVAQRRLSDNADGEELLTGSPAKVSIDGGEVDGFAPDARLFRDRAYAVAEVPPALQGCSFVRGSIEGNAGVCTAGGVLYVLTPLAERNRDSLELDLRRRGFVKVRIPEFQLFDTGEGNVCSVFQKRVVEGESLKLGKWGVIVLRGATEER